MQNSDLELLGVVLIFGSILFLAYVAARFVGKKASASMQSKHMQVIEQISLGLDKRLLLVRIGSEHFVFLSGKKEFKQVARIKLDEEQMKDEQKGKPSGEPIFDFRQILERYIKTPEDKKQKMNIRQNVETEPNKRDIMQRNIHKLEQLREKRYDKEV